MSMNVNDSTNGLVVETRKDNFRILWTYIPLMPTTDVRLASPWLAVVRWLYDGTGNNGMPGAEDNQRMLELDNALGQMEDDEVCFEAYRRIGAGLREFVFYTANQEKFLEGVNAHLASYPEHPIEIKFYRDETWSDLQDLIDDLKPVKLGR